jgi:dihydroorotate dehydrogenase (NAD+) catalytic subunit
VADCNNEKKLPAFCASVVKCTKIHEGVYKLVLKHCTSGNLCKPFPGQFYMLRSVKSKVFLSRPISIYQTKEKDSVQYVEFLILVKGQGTKELCALKTGEMVDVLGPQGNTFIKPEPAEKIAIIGGGIGVAPVAGFASTLKTKTYDFYASFRSGSYGLEIVKAKKLVITTDDGSVGIHGILPVAFNKETIQNEKYTCVYACGPTPMLKYLQELCRECGIKCYLSMEAYMACGMGACLGCTITTVEGNKRCCVDGPVFEGEKLIFPENKKCAVKPKSRKTAMPNLSVKIAGVKFSNPVIAASGTFGFGLEYEKTIDLKKLGGICSKGLTLDPKPGNTGIRLHETSGGLINSIGLENPGIDVFIKQKLPAMLKLPPVAIANLSGSSIETYVKGAELLDATKIPMIELNISCPNVKAGGMAFGLESKAAYEVTRAVRKATKKPLMVKLSPNAPDLIAVADAVRRAGADAISLVNTFQAMAIDVEKGTLIFDNVKAGLSGPCIKPIALRMVYDVCAWMKKLPEEERIPVVGLGGISTWQDAVEFIMAGAIAVQVGSATFAEPRAMANIVRGLEMFMKRKGYLKIEDFRGIVLP